MQKAKSVIGKDVLSLATGGRIHSVKDILVGAGNDVVVAFLVDEGGLLGTSTVVPYEAIQSIGRDAVVIDQESSVVPAANTPEVKAILDRNNKPVGKPVYTEDGQKMGDIADFYFDDANGRITGFEVSGGLLGNLARGSSYLGADDVTLAGRDVVFVTRSGGENLEGQVGGLQGAIGDAGNTLGATKDRLTAQAGDEATPEQSLVGRRVAGDVIDERGSIVVAAGQRITAQHVERATATNNLQTLQTAADAADAQERQELTEQTVQKAGDAAGEIWDKFTSKLAEVTDSSGARADEQQTRDRLAQITDAIGRPVTKVVLDRDDDVILDLGDIITHQAVQRAHDAGTLDSLLESVYKGEVAFERDEMRAKVDATSSIDKASGGAAVVEQLAIKVETADKRHEKEAEARRREDAAAREDRAKERERRAAARENSASEGDSAQPTQKAVTSSGASGG